MKVQFQPTTDVDPAELKKIKAQLDTSETTIGAEMPDVASTVSADLEFEKSLEDLESGLIDGEEVVLPRGGSAVASTDWMPM